MEKEKTVDIEEIGGGIMQDPEVTERKLAEARQKIAQLEYQIQMMNEQMMVERESYLDIISQVNAKYGQVATENTILSSQQQG